METKEFVYSESEDLGKGRHRQTIIYKGEEIGFLITIEKNWLAPLEERYILPDVEIGMSEPTSGLLKGKKGWIEFKVFDDYDTAFDYADKNFKQVSYLFKYGDFD